MRRVSIFGATGSIGQSTIDLIRRDREKYQVVALTGGANIDQLAAYAIEFNAEIAVTADPDQSGNLKLALSGSGVKYAAGPEALLMAADRPADLFMSAIVGVAGLEPGFRALRHGTTLALANKESLVTAGPLLLAEAAKHGATILPVDSEHSGVFQALVGEDISTVERVIITASGGAFRDWPVEKLAQATLAQASSHPNWNMGQRITIDSASMFNKALELIETKEFFQFFPDQIEVLLHPQSLIHAMVGYCDGGILAHIGPADMRHAIGYALNWPNRGNVPVERLDLARIGRFDFLAPDPLRYPAIDLARGVMSAGGLAGAAFNGAKERALDGFIAGEIGFMDMAGVVDVALSGISGEMTLSDEITLDNVRETDHLARQRVNDAISGR